MKNQKKMKAVYFITKKKILNPIYELHELLFESQLFNDSFFKLLILKLISCHGNRLIN